MSVPSSMYHLFIRKKVKILTCVFLVHLPTVHQNTRTLKCSPTLHILHVVSKSLRQHGLTVLLQPKNDRGLRQNIYCSTTSLDLHALTGHKTVHVLPCRLSGAMITCQLIIHNMRVPIRIISCCRLFCIPLSFLVTGWSFLEWFP